jgi:hypothetical protein
VHLVGCPRPCFIESGTLSWYMCCATLMKYNCT